MLFLQKFSTQTVVKIMYKQNTISTSVKYGNDVINTTQY